MKPTLKMPDSPDVSLEGKIRERAHQIWLDRGCPQDSAESDWFEAERQLMEETGELGQRATPAHA